MRNYIAPSNAAWKQQQHQLGLPTTPPPLPPAATVGYLAQHTLVDQLPGLAADFDPPPQAWCDACNKGRGISRVNVWFGSEGTVTPLHFDSYDNLLVQIVGHKYVRLYAPDQTEFLYASSSSEATMAQQNISPVDVEDEARWREEFPLFAQAAFTETVLGPGDTLFLPEGHWHYVRSLSPSFSLNFWF